MSTGPPRLCRSGWLADGLVSPEVQASQPTTHTSNPFLLLQPGPRLHLSGAGGRCREEMCRSGGAISAEIVRRHRVPAAANHRANESGGQRTGEGPWQGVGDGPATVGMLLLFFAMQPLQPTISDPTSTRRQTKPLPGFAWQRLSVEKSRGRMKD